MPSNNHNIAFGQASVVKFSNYTSFNRNIIESALIKYHSENFYNIHPGPHALDPFIVHKIINFHNL